MRRTGKIQPQRVRDSDPQVARFVPCIALVKQPPLPVLRVDSRDGVEYGFRFKKPRRSPASGPGHSQRMKLPHPKHNKVRGGRLIYGGYPNSEPEKPSFYGSSW